MKIFIFGSEGFIGSHCIKFYLLQEETVYGADIYEQPSQNYNYLKSSRLSPNVEEWFQKQQFDVVINAAGSGNVQYSMTHPVADFEANCLDTIRILDSIRRFQLSCRYLHISSAAVYGNPATLPITEDQPIAPLSSYGWHKSISEQICREYTAIYNLKTAIIRPFSVYGEGLKKQMFWDIYQKINKVGRGGIVELFGTGNESRDYIYINDLIKGISIVIHNGKMEGEIYNLGSGIETSIKNSVKIFFREIDFDVEYKFNGINREGDPKNWRADINKIKELGYGETTNLEIGLKRTIKWMQEF